MELKTARNCHARYHLNYHLIMVTKYRKRCITQDLFLSLKDQLEKIAKMNGAEILEIAYEPDHVHILLEAPPQACLSEMINAMKTTSSRKVRKELDPEQRRGADRSDPHLHTRAGNRGTRR